MFWYGSLLAIGFIIGWLMASFMEGRGGLALMWSVIVGIIGSFAGGILFARFGQRFIPEGYEIVASMIAAVVGALLFVVIARIIKR